MELPLSEICLAGTIHGGRNRIMKSHRIGAIAAAVALASATALIAGQQTATIAGTAKDEAKKPYTDYTVRARDVATGRASSAGA